MLPSGSSSATGRLVEAALVVKPQAEQLASAYALRAQVVAEGRSDAVLGNPVTSVAWLARKVDQFGVRLRAGDIVLPGACMRAIDAAPGDDFVADFDGLGSVRLSFE